MHTVHTCLVQKEPEDLFPFVSPKYPSLSSPPFLFFTLLLIYIHCFTHDSRLFLRELTKVRKTRPLGCSRASPLLQVSPLFSNSLFFSWSLSPSLVPHLILVFFLSCLQYLFVFFLFITWHSPFVPPPISVLLLLLPLVPLCPNSNSSLCSFALFSFLSFIIHAHTHTHR